MLVLHVLTLCSVNRLWYLVFKKTHEIATSWKKMLFTRF